MRRHSIRNRVAVAFALCIAVLSVAWGLAFFAAVRLSEDRVLTQQLKVAAESYPDLTSNLRGYDEASMLPETLKEWGLSHPKEGLYEFTAEELHVAVVSKNDLQKPAFVVFDVAGIEAASSEDWWLLMVISGVVGSLGIVGFGLGLVVMRKAVAPVVQLAKVVSDIDPKQLSREDIKRVKANRFDDEEVGLLADTIEKALERISAFIERERNFTNSASHELRTPITVISGAIEVLQQSTLSEADFKVLDRIKRATVDMKNMIEMFLCIARETDNGWYEERFLVLPLVKQAVEQQRYLLNGKKVEVKIDDAANPNVHGHSQAFAIAVNNLVRNAFEHTTDSEHPILICLENNALIVTNNLSSAMNTSYSKAFASHYQGYGLGLGIVQRLCERNGWSFSLQVDEKHVVARLSWKS